MESAERKTSYLNTESNFCSEEEKSSERVNLAASAAPNSRFMPQSSHSTESGPSYYLDKTGCQLPTLNYSGNFIVATGNIDSTYAAKELVKLAQFVYTNDFWNHQLEQVHINPDKKADLYPRVGKQIIRFGRIEKVEKKFDNLKLFYDRVMPVVGWNKYRELNIAYTNQVIGKK